MQANMAEEVQAVVPLQDTAWPSPSPPLVFSAVFQPCLGSNVGAS